MHRTVQVVFPLLASGFVLGFGSLGCSSSKTPESEGPLGSSAPTASNGAQASASSTTTGPTGTTAPPASSPSATNTTKPTPSSTLPTSPPGTESPPGTTATAPIDSGLPPVAVPTHSSPPTASEPSTPLEPTGEASATAPTATADPSAPDVDAPDTSGAGGSPDDGPDEPPVQSEHPETPCDVPDYIFDQPTPIGWATQGGGTTGGGAVGDGTAAELVTSLTAFKDAVGDGAPKVIFVQGDFEPSEIEIGSNKTIIGCSSGASLRGHVGIGSGSSNIIIRNLTIVGYGEGNCALDPNYDPGTGCSSGNDAVGVNGNAHHVWFDHCAVRDGTDGNLDVTNDADFVTISWTKFSYTPRTDDSGDDSTGGAGHRYSNLVGGTDNAPTNWPGTRPLNVTWHHNWWAESVVERQPRVRYGRNHVFNNYYNSSTTNYCIRAGIEASVLIEGNVFDGVDSPHQFNNDDDEKTAFIQLGEGDRENSYDGTSEGEKNGGGEPFTPPYDYELDPAGDVPAAIVAGAGPH